MDVMVALGLTTSVGGQVVVYVAAARTEAVGVVGVVGVALALVPVLLGLASV